MAEKRKLTKGEKWAVGGAAGFIVAAIAFTLYEKHAQAAQLNATGNQQPPSGGTSSSSGGTGDTNTSGSDNASGQTSQTGGSALNGSANSAQNDGDDSGG